MLQRIDLWIALGVLALWFFVLPLIYNHFDREVRTALSETPKDIHIAARLGDLNMVKLLIEQGIDVNVRDKNRKTPLFLASESGHFDAAKFLVERGADVNVECQNGITPLWAAATRGSRKILKLLVDNGAEINFPAASMLDDVNFFDNFFEKGGDVNQKIGQKSLIHLVASKGSSKEIVELLVRKGACVNERDEEGWTPLHLAATCKNPQTAEALIAHVVDIHAKTIYDQTPLHCASYSGCVRVVELLIACGARIDENSKGGTPLYTAVENGYPEIVRVLIANGANVNARNESGNTPLHQAVKKEYSSIARTPFELPLKTFNQAYLEIARILIENGADIHAEWGIWGLTPLYFARSPEMIQLLQSYGAKTKMYWWSEVLQMMGILNIR